MTEHPFSLILPLGSMSYKNKVQQHQHAEHCKNNYTLTNLQYLNLIFNQCSISMRLKTSENLRFSDVFWGYRSGALLENGLITNLKLLFTVFQPQVWASSFNNWLNLNFILLNSYQIYENTVLYRYNPKTKQLSYIFERPKISINEFLFISLTQW